MTTGIETWNVNLTDIGPMYPFAGSELLLSLIGVGSWLVWHVIQARAETREVAAEEAEYSKPGALASLMDKQTD